MLEGGHYFFLAVLTCHVRYLDFCRHFLRLLLASSFGHELVLDAFRTFLEEIYEAFALLVTDGLNLVLLGGFDGLLQFVDGKEEETLLFLLHAVLEDKPLVVADDVDEELRVRLHVDHLLQFANPFSVDVKGIVDFFGMLPQVFMEKALILEVSVDSTIVVDVLDDVDVFVRNQNMVENDRRLLIREDDHGVVEKKLVVFLGIEMEDFINLFAVGLSGDDTMNLGIEETDDRDQEEKDDEEDDDDLNEHLTP